MKIDLTRRNALKVALLSTATTGCAGNVERQHPNSTEGSNDSTSDFSAVFKDGWASSNDRIWLGENVWANPMEDWLLTDGAAETGYAGGNRSVHSLTHELRRTDQPFSIEATVTKLDINGTDGGASIRIGMRNEIDDYRSSCFEQQGFDAGVIGNTLVLGNKKAPLDQERGDHVVRLVLTGQPTGDKVELSISAFLKNELLAMLSLNVQADEIIGNVGLVSNFNIKALTHRDASSDDLGSRYRFSNWSMSGAAFNVDSSRTFGPILWVMYTLNDLPGSEGQILKLSAFTGPLGEKDNKQLSLQIKIADQWQEVAQEALNEDGWLATFKVINWQRTETTPYRVVYLENLNNGRKREHVYEGLVRSAPLTGKLKMAALTCQNDYAFPYAPVAKNLTKLDPDLLFFSGDQIYESHGGFGIVRAPAEQAILNYLRKFYQFGWAFRDVMRDRPTVCLPDDHDVLQGNLWGESGAAMQDSDKDPSASVLGGYIEPVRMVNAVHRTCVAHHPDPADPTPSSRGMSVYYTDLVYGDVSFAIIADRQWKSGPERINVKVGVTGEDEPPLLINPEFNPDGLALLGDRQERFLDQWSQDWRGHSLKAILSQTVFAGLATHQPQPDRYLKYDFDGSGWPAKARDNAVSIMRNSKALHICGDTHLGTLSQYGVNQQRDSNWAFCTPAIAAGWPRWWLPDTAGLPHKNRPAHQMAQTGEYLDAFGNKVYVYAAANPEVGTSENRYQKAHQKGSGFGVIEFDTNAKTYTLSAYRFLVDVANKSDSNLFDGWPVTIHQDENIGKNRLG